MVARRRLWGELKERAGYIGLLLLVTVGLPLIGEIAGSKLAGLPKLAAVGWYALRAAPLLLVASVFLSVRGIRQKQARLNARLAAEGVTYLLLPRVDAKTLRLDKLAVWDRISDVLPFGEHVGFELSGGSLGIAFGLRAMPGVERAVLTQLMAEWPGMAARRVDKPEDDPLTLPEDRHGYWIELKPRRKEQPIVPSGTDPLLALLAELARLPDGVTGGMQLLVRGDPFTRLDLGSKAAKLTSKKPKTGPYALRKSLADRRHEKTLDTRAQETFLEVRILVWAMAGSPEMAKSVAKSLARSLAAQYGPSNPLGTGKQGTGALVERTFPTFSGHPWTATELASLGHLVGEVGSEIASPLRTAPANPLPPAPESRLPRQARVARLVRDHMAAPQADTVEA